MFHPTGSVAATCCGQKHDRDDEYFPEGQNNRHIGENSLKVWSMEFLNSTAEAEEDDLETKRLCGMHDKM